jgi:hypothetical protein
VTQVIVKCADGRVKEYGLGEKGQLCVKLKQPRRTPVQITEAFTFGGGEKESVQEVCGAISSPEMVTDAAIPETVGDIPLGFCRAHHMALCWTSIGSLRSEPSRARRTTCFVLIGSGEEAEGH